MSDYQWLHNEPQPQRQQKALRLECKQSPNSRGRHGEAQGVGRRIPTSMKEIEDVSKELEMIRESITKGTRENKILNPNGASDRRSTRKL